LCLIRLVIIYWALDLSQGISKAVGPGREARPILELFECSWLNLGVIFTGSCKVRTGGLGVSMRFMGPKEGGVVAVSKTPESSLVGVFAASASQSDAALPFKGRSQGSEGGGKGGYNGT
jgi:hypothetical protein